MIEMDIRLTADNKVVVFHDDHLQRMTHTTPDQLVVSTTYEDLPAIVPTVTICIPDAMRWVLANF